MRNPRGIPGAILGGLRGLASLIPYAPRALRRQGHKLLVKLNIATGDRLAGQLSRVDPRRATYLRGAVLARSQPHHDHTEFWSKAAARFPVETNFVRKTIHAALKAGNAQVVEAGIRTLIESRRTQWRDSNFVIGLANIYASQSDGPRIRKLVRQFMRSLRRKPDYRMAAVRLSRLIFAYFPRAPSTAGLRDGPGFDQKFLKMLERSSVKPQPKSILRRVVALENALAASASMALFDTDISAAQCRKFVASALDALAGGNGFSCIRLGDGESSCLSYEPHLADFAQADTADRERAWWGAELDASERLKISRQIASAIWNADWVGIPTVSRILRDINLSENDRLEGGRTGRGLRSVLHTFEHMDRFRPGFSNLQQFTSCHVHQDLMRWDAYSELFERAGEVVLISCHPGLPDVLERRYGARIAASIVVPPRHASIPLLHEKPAASAPLPVVIEDVSEQLGELPRNRLVLVGAGYLGKSLVDLAKRRGGVALDIGSVFDHWVGVNTRSYLDLARH